MKHPMVKISALSASILAASSAMAGGFDNSSRAFNIIYGDNNVIDLSYGQTSVPMKARIDRLQRGENSLAAPTQDKISGSGEIIDDFTRPQVGIRYNIMENVTCAAQAEQPFAAQVDYADDSLAYVVTDENGVPLQDDGSPAVDGGGNLIATPASKTAPISTKYESESFTVACGYDFALAMGSLKVFAGPKIQSVNGFFSQDLSPEDVGNNDNLNVTLDGGNEVGYVAGVAYEIPEYALRASILYHSQIDYSATGQNKTFLPLSAVTGNSADDRIYTFDATTETFTPQTVELAFQSGIAENTLAFLKMRWSEYGKLANLDVQGSNETAVGALTYQQLATANDQLDALINPNVSMFSNDTLDYSLGLGHRFNDQLTLGASFSGSIKLGGKSDDTPLGADSTTLRLPGDTSHTLSFGAEYSVLPTLKVSGGLGYTFINDYVVQTTSNSYRAEFSKTEATSFQFGLTYEI